MHLLNDPALGRWDLHRGLVGHHLREHLILFDHVALFDQHSHHFTFNDTLTNIW
jgi:hypothetical protein